MIKTLKDFVFEKKRILLRCDFQVPLDEKGNILDDFRIKATIPTIEYLIEKKAKVILMSHWKPMESQKKAESLKLISPVIEKYLGKKIKFVDDCVGEKTEKEIGKMQSGEIVLLENLRSHPEEKANDENFARQLARLGDIYINDAFGVSHRSHASVVGIPRYLPHGAGLLLIKEIQALQKIMKNPLKPLIAIIGGAKVETKTKVIEEISKNADFILVGDLIKREIKEKNIKFKNPQKIIFPFGSVQSLDINQQTINLFEKKIKKAKTVFWTGPLGMVEKKEFQKGTLEIAKAIIKSRAFSVVGGGETVWFLGKGRLINKFSHISTGGGAMLDFIADGKLVGIEALK